MTVRSIAPLAPLALASLLALAGCGSTPSKPADKAPAAQAVAKIDHDAWASLGYRLDWQGFPFAGTIANPKITFVTPSASHVLVQESNSYVSLLEVNNGARRWSVEFGNNLTKFVGLDSDPADANRILVSAESELFIVAAQTGGITSRERFDKVVNTKPVLIDGLAIYGTSIGEVLAHRPGATLKAWGYGTGSAIDAAPTAMKDGVAVVTINGDVLFFTPSGLLQGRNMVLSNTTTNPVSSGGLLAIAGLDQSLWCFDQKGNQVWRLRQSAPLTVQPTALENSVVCELPETGLTNVDFASGNVLWSNPKVRGTVVASHNGRLVVWNGSTANLVDAKRGDVLAAVELPGVVSLTADQFDGGNLYAATAEGSIAKFRLRK